MPQSGNSIIDYPGTKIWAVVHPPDPPHPASLDFIGIVTGQFNEPGHKLASLARSAVPERPDLHGKTHSGHYLAVASRKFYKGHRLLIGQAPERFPVLVCRLANNMLGQ